MSKDREEMEEDYMNNGTVNKRPRCILSLKTKGDHKINSRFKIKVLV